MKVIRSEIFETNSSSTHSLVLKGYADKNYMPPGTIVKVEWSDEQIGNLTSLQEKVSYLVSHIANKYSYNVHTYEDFIDELKNDYEYRQLEDFLSTLGNGYRISLPKEPLPFEDEDGEKYNVDIEDLISINHQLQESCLEDVLDSLLMENSLETKLARVLDPETKIEFGHD